MIMSSGIVASWSANNLSSCLQRRRQFHSSYENNNNLQYIILSLGQHGGITFNGIPISPKRLSSCTIPIKVPFGKGNCYVVTIISLNDN